MNSVIDFSTLLKRLAGDRALLQELLEVFADDAPSKLEALREAHESGDLLQVSRRAHAIKGAVGAVSADGARECATALERAATEGDAAKVAELVPVVIGHVEAVCRTIRDYKT